MLVITGATGHVGRKLSEKLLDAGEKVRVIGRSKERLQPLVDRGAEAAVGTIEDTKFLTEAFKGADAVFAMIPPKYDSQDIRAYQKLMADYIATAIEKAGVKNVISLSSIGAHRSDENGVVAGLHDFEERLNRIEGINVKHLRAALFMENTLFNIPHIKSEGVMGSPIKPDTEMPVVATEDIAAVAADLMKKRDFTGHKHQYVLGPRDMTYSDMTNIIAQAIEKPDLHYVEFPSDETLQAMTKSGLSKSYAESLIDFYEGINKGVVKEDIKRNDMNTTPTEFTEFAKTFATVYQQS